MGGDKRPRPIPHKTVIIADGNRIIYAGFADDAQVKQIMVVLKKPHTVTH